MSALSVYYLYGVRGDYGTNDGFDDSHDDED